MPKLRAWVWRAGLTRGPHGVNRRAEREVEKVRPRAGPAGQQADCGPHLDWHVREVSP